MVAPGAGALVFNGEIYNYVELRRELASHGATSRSSGDTEVLLNGWLQWGFDLLPRLNGMWAFALYDERRRGLLLCRDRFGEKPLFWAPWRGGVAFASEIKQLAGFPGVDLRLDAERAAALIQVLEAAHVLDVELAGLLGAAARGLRAAVSSASEAVYRARIEALDARLV